MASLFNFLRLPLLIIVLGLAACATPVGRKDLLEFLADGVTRRDDVRLKLGEPSAQYEGARILAYRLATDDGGYVLVGQRDNWLGVQYSLILVFDDEAVLRRHSLVAVR